MTDNLKTQIKNVMNENYAQQPACLEYMEMIKKLNDGKWIDKQIIVQTLMNYSALVEKVMNELSHSMLLGLANYNALSKINENYKIYYKAVKIAAKEANELMDKLGIKE